MPDISTDTDFLAKFLMEMETFVLDGAGILLALSLIVALRILLPEKDRRLIRVPLFLLTIHGALVVLKVLAPAGSASQNLVSILSLMFLLFSIGRGAFVFIIHITISRKITRPLPKIFQDIIQGLIYAGVLLVTLRAAGVEPGSLLTTSALITAILGLSLQDTLGNMFAGLAIQAQRPFDVGDWIEFDEIDAHIGKVVEINWRATKVQTIDHVEITIPNGALAKAPIRNFSKPDTVVRRKEIVVAPYDISPLKAHAIFKEALELTPGVCQVPKPQILTNEFTERGIEYDVRYFIRNFYQRESISSDVQNRLWYAMQRASIHIPVPQREIQMTHDSEESISRIQKAKFEARAEALSNVDFIAALPEEVRYKIAELAETRLYGPGEVIMHQGEPGHELFMIEFGEVQVLIGHSNPMDMNIESQTEVTRLGENDFFGEMAAMTGSKRRATVRATRETELLVVDKDAFAAVLQKSPELIETVSEVIAEREKELHERVKATTQAPKETTEENKELLSRIKSFFSI